MTEQEHPEGGSAAPDGQDHVVDSVDQASAPGPPREVKIAPDERLNVAYNSHFTQSSEIRAQLLQELVRRTQRGARAHCSRCERISVRFSPIKTPFGTFVIALCEQCGAWYLM